jgi:addiction module HigA family antidote
MKNPRHPGLLVKHSLDDIEPSAGAKAIGVTRQQLHNVISGRSSISPEMAVRLEKAFGGTADQWLRMQVAYDLARVRVREKEIVVPSLRRRAA